MRPDRVIIGEVRGGEALDLISAMNTGHSGSLGTIHSNNPRECLVRIETLALMSDTNVSVQAIRSQVSSAINIIIQLSRMPDGSRKVTYISEGLGMDVQGNHATQDIFLFDQRGRGPDGKILGELVPTGKLPSFMKEIEVNHLPIPKTLFTAKGNPPSTSGA